MKKLSIILIVTGIIILTAKYTSPRGIRNNNPGNIKKNDTEWEGLREIQTDPVFFQFIDPIYGIRALAKILKNYYIKYGISSIRNIINRYAPSSENETENYIKFVSDSTGINADYSINLDSSEMLLKIIKAIIIYENGFNPYSTAAINKGISLV